MKKQFLDTGRIVGTHGIKGEVRIEPWSDSPEFLCAFKKLYLDEKGTDFIEVKCRPHKNIALVTVRGVDSIEKADELRGKILYIDRGDVRLAEGAHFVQDIIGLKVTDADTGEVYGTVRDVLKTGSNDVYEMQGADKKLFYIPVIPDIIVRPDIEGGAVYIRPMKGLFDDED